jgi:stage II sporulation protein D
MLRKWLLPIGLLALFAAGCVPPEPPPRRGVVRVAIVQGASAVTLSSNSVLSVKDARSGKTLSTAGRGQAIPIRVARNGLTVGGTNYPAGHLDIRSTSSEITLNGKTYPGSFRIVPRQGGLLAVNIVDLDTYLKAVVPSEMPPEWPREALKAQAIVSRSFVLFHALRHRQREYDISSRTQVYDPDRTDTRTSKAVDATRNVVLFYEGKLLLPYFSTCCGGFTEYPANVWQTEGRFPPPVQCPYCREAPGFHWRARLSLRDLQKKLRSAGFAGARSIAVHRRSSSGGRITALKVECEDGEKIIRINPFRMAMGPDLIKSGFFDMEAKADSIIFTGRGWGHGVGMCQKGAKILAEHGKSFDSILRYYFRGATTKKMRW